MENITPKKPNKTGAFFTIKAIEKAIDYLGIYNPVYLKWSSGTNRRGCWRPKNYNWKDPVIYLENNHLYDKTYTNEFNHSITLSTHLEGEDLEHTLWHELTHAKQAERFDYLEEYWLAYRYWQQAYGYKENPSELEANAQAIARPFNIVENNDHQEEKKEIEEALLVIERCKKTIENFK